MTKLEKEAYHNQCQKELLISINQAVMCEGGTYYLDPSWQEEDAKYLVKELNEWYENQLEENRKFRLQVVDFNFTPSWFSSKLIITGGYSEK